MVIDRHAADPTARPRPPESGSRRPPAPARTRTFFACANFQSIGLIFSWIVEIARGLLIDLGISSALISRIWGFLVDCNRALLPGIPERWMTSFPCGAVEFLGAICREVGEI